jgi:hypothetical protein
VSDWHADHVYKHDSRAIEPFTLVAFLAYNLFHVFLICNLKNLGCVREWILSHS